MNYELQARCPVKRVKMRPEIGIFIGPRNESNIEPRIDQIKCVNLPSGWAVAAVEGLKHSRCKILDQRCPVLDMKKLDLR
jgi:hypothetical protein